MNYAWMNVLVGPTLELY